MTAVGQTNSVIRRCRLDVWFCRNRTHMLGDLWERAL